MFSKHFYKRELINAAIPIYENICSISITDKRDFIQVSLIPMQKTIDLKELGYEFSNYVLSMHK